jgi:CheY-like chemotaxis protein
MSHELRTPLNAIIGFSELLSDGVAGALSVPQAEYIGHVVTAGRHLLELVNEVLDLSRVSSGRMDLTLATGSLRAVLDEAQRMAEALLAARDLRLVIDSPPDLPPVRFDRLRIRQVVYNYLSNAIKFSPPGSEIALTIEHRGDQVWVACRDQGHGIAPEDLPRLFREFERVGDQTCAEGTGLGLALSRQLIELHGGMVGVESTLGVGSMFSFTLPVTGPGAGPAAGATVLVVDADPYAAERVCGHVRAAGCTAAVARDPDEALRLARQLAPAAITVGSGGAPGLREALAAEDTTRPIPVIDIDEVVAGGDQRNGFVDALHDAGVNVARR